MTIVRNARGDIIRRSRNLRAMIEHVRPAARARETGQITAGELESAVLESGLALWG